VAESLGTATLELEGDLSGLERDLATARSKTTAEGKKASAGFGATFASGIRKATVPAIAAIGALAVGAKRTIDSASNLAEAQSAVNTTFGKSADIINEYASSAEDSFSKVDFLGAAKTFAVFGKAAGATGEDLAHFSSKLVFAAQDMASFHNADPSEVLENLRAGLAGETEPLRKYGILMTEAALKEFAWKDGITERGKEMTEEEKVLARRRFILANLGDAQGDYARTADSAANVERRQAANLEDTSAKIGQGLMPAYQGLQAVLLAVTDFMSRHAEAVRIVAGVLVVLAAGVLIVRGAMAAWRAAVVVATAVQWAWNAALTANPIGLIILALVALGVALVVAYKKSERFRAVVTAAINFVKRHWKLLLAAIPLIGPILALVVSKWDTLKSKVSAAVDRIKAVVTTLKSVVARMFNAMAGPIDRVVNAIRSIAGAVSYAIGVVRGLASDILSIFPSDPTPGFDVPGVPYFDSGGVMPGPRGVHRLALVAGGETILPTHKRGFGGVGASVTFNFPRYSGNRRELIADIKRGLEEHRRQHGGGDPW
jgi:hypothetical protein